MLQDTYHRLRQLTTSRNRIRADGDWRRTLCRHDRRVWQGYGRTIEMRGPTVPSDGFWYVVQRDHDGGREVVVDHGLSRPDAVATAEAYMSELAQREGARLATTTEQIATAD